MPHASCQMRLPNAAWDVARNWSRRATRHRGATCTVLVRSANGHTLHVRPSPCVCVCVWQERLLVLKMVIKCADIGNVTKGQSYATRWTDRVTQEFFEQGDAERSLGLPVTPMLDRHTASVPKLQIGFYNFIVKPMYEAMDLLVPMEPLLTNLDEMYAYWRERLPSEDDQAKVAAPQKPAPAEVAELADLRKSRRSSTTVTPKEDP